MKPSGSDECVCQNRRSLVLVPTSAQRGRGALRHPGARITFSTVERFSGKDFHVKFSTGATYELYRALIELGRRAEKDCTVVVTFLENRMHEDSSASGFDLHPVPAELGSQGLAELAELLAQLAWHLCQETPDPTLCDMTWDRERRLSWLS